MRARGRWAEPALAVAALSAVGGALRVATSGQSVFADELATYWIVSTHGFSDLFTVVHSDAEISPPLSFLAAWLTTRIDLTPELLRAPSLVAGLATIPGVYLVGARTAGRAAGLLAAALTTFSPFMIYYSSEARGYALAMALVTFSTLAMLVAAQTGRRRWWVAYGALSCAAMYTHYTCAFVLGFQLAWLMWVHPEARRAALLTNVGAALAYLPWLSGLRADLASPTTAILSALQPFNPQAVKVSLVHWSVAYPYSIKPASDLPGIPALILLGAAVALGAGAVAGRRLRHGRVGPLAAEPRYAVLLVGLALSVPVSAAVLSAIGSNLFSTRNLAASWPGFALALAALLMSAGPRLRMVTAAVAVVAFAIGGLKLLETTNGRPQYEEVANSINRQAQPGDVVIDETAVISPGPLSHIDPFLDPRGAVFRSEQPQQHVRPFSALDMQVPPDAAARKAVAAAHGRQIFLATDEGRARQKRPLGRYRLVQDHHYPGLIGLDLQVYALPAS